MRRLDVKIVLILFVTVALPLAISVYLVNRAVDTSLALGLNAKVVDQLEQGLEVHRGYITELKRGVELRFERLVDSHRLFETAIFDDRPQLEMAIAKLIEQDPSLISVRLTGPGTDPLEVSTSGSVDQVRTMAMNRAIPLGRFVHLQAVFGVDTAIFEAYNTAGESFTTYRALAEAPPDYLNNRFVWVYISLLGIIVAISMTIGILWTRRMARRIHRLAEATTLVAAGDLSVRVDPGSDDEVGRLVESFNGMVSELMTSRTRIGYLQKISAWQEMARRLAHEIKNPLTPIHLAAQQLRQKYPGGDEQFQRLLEQSTEIIEEEVVTLRRLTSDFSSFARLPEVRPEVVDLADFLTDCEASLSHLAVQDEIVLTFDLPTEPILVRFDRIMMKRVIDNLIRNGAEALKGVDADKPQISVYAVKSDDDKQPEVEIRIEDNGPGIQPDHHPSIFDPYFTTKSEGTGLGLAISKKIVLEHQGQIWVEETVGGGAAFVIVVPTAEADKEDNS